MSWKRGFAWGVKQAVRALLPAKMKAHTVLTGPLRGARIVTSWHDYPGAILGTTERSLLHWFAANVQSGETWLDIGAHYGYTAIALSRLTGTRGRVLAFEPVALTAAALEQTRRLNLLAQLTVVPLALGDSPRSKSLPCVRGMADSTIRRPADWQTISIVSLDGCWQKLAGARPTIDGVKIDVQGMELEVLRGMRELLAASAPKLVIEFHAGVDRDAILALLTTFGYSPAAVPIRGRAGLSHQIADDQSYFFPPKSRQCEFSSTRLITHLS